MPTMGAESVVYHRETVKSIVPLELLSCGGPMASRGYQALPGAGVQPLRGEGVPRCFDVSLTRYSSSSVVVEVLALWGSL